MADWQTLARKAAQQEGVPPDLFVALVRQESGGRPGAVSGAGAIGYTQLMPGTARSLGVDPSNPWQNLIGGAKYLRQQLHTFHGNVDYALAAYNAGPGAVQKYGGIPPYAETQNYVKSIRGMLGGKGPSTVPLGSVTPNTQGVTGPGGSTAGIDTSSGVDVSALLGVLEQQHQAPASVGLQAPSFSAAPALPQGYQALASSAPPQPKVDIQSLLSMVQTPGTDIASTSASQQTGGNGTAPADATSGGAAAPGGIAKGFKAGDPVADGTSIGGLHQTEGLPGFPAHDYFAPAGTPTVAPVTGRVVKLSGHDPKLGPIEGPHGPLGWSVYIQGSDGRTYYLTHMGSRNVKIGQRVKAGQVIGSVANYAKYGTPSHIHMGVHG